MADKYDRIDHVAKFNPFHDAKGKFASSKGMKSYSANPHTKAGQMAIARSTAAGYGGVMNVHRESKGENIVQNHRYIQNKVVPTKGQRTKAQASAPKTVQQMQARAHQNRVKGTMGATETAQAKHPSKPKKQAAPKQPQATQNPQTSTKPQAKPTKTNQQTIQAKQKATVDAFDALNKAPTGPSIGNNSSKAMQVMTGAPDGTRLTFQAAKGLVTYTKVGNDWEVNDKNGTTRLKAGVAAVGIGDLLNNGKMIGKPSFKNSKNRQQTGQKTKQNTVKQTGQNTIHVKTTKRKSGAIREADYDTSQVKGAKNKSFRGTAHGKDLTAELESGKRKLGKATDWDRYSGENRYTNQIADMQGFNSPPKVVSKQEFDKLVKQSGDEFFRTWRPGTVDGKRRTAKEMIDEFCTNDDMAMNGTGMRAYGDGVYTASSKMIKETLGSSTRNARQNAIIESRFYGDGKTTHRMTWLSKPNIIKYKDMEKEWKKLTPAQKKKYGNHMNTYACAKGYDAIETESKYSGYMTVLNRSKLAVCDDYPI